MHTTLSIRELSRGTKKLLDYDYVEIEDRKSHEYKGIFIPRKYAQEVKNFINEKLLSDKNKKKEILLSYAGIAHGDTEQKNFKELKKEVGESE